MSAYVVSDETITAIVRGALKYLPTSYRRDDRDLLGQMLVDENYRSVNYRYDEDTKPHKFQFKNLKKFDDGILFGCMRNYNYQSCETEDYFSSDAYYLLQNIQREMLEARLETEGLEMPWGIDE